MINNQKPTTDFNAVRDGRRSPWYSYELDLSIARIDAPSQDFILPIAGNSFYVDRAPDVGSAYIQFQDTSFDRAMLPIYAGPGFIANAPFTQIKITNAAQPGKTLRIFYGIDIDFLPGTSSEIVLSGAVKTVSENSTSLLDSKKYLSSSAFLNVGRFNVGANGLNKFKILGVSILNNTASPQTISLTMIINPTVQFGLPIYSLSDGTVGSGFITNSDVVGIGTGTIIVPSNQTYNIPPEFLGLISSSIGMGFGSSVALPIFFSLEKIA